MKPALRAVTGILLLDKPAGISSNRALQLAKRLYGAAKAGHTGSLDPLATGLLPICFGEATKIAGHLLGSHKAYAARCRLGVTTTTDDSEGAIVRTRPVPTLDDARIDAALATLRGRIVQVPPAYSAIKQGGVPLYRRARRGEDVQVPSREVEVHRLELLARADEVLDLHVECGSGTYVRSLVRDMGETLGCGAHLTALRRLWVDPFREPHMHALQALEQAHADGGFAALDRLLLPLEAGLSALPLIALDDVQATRLRHGQALAMPDAPACPRARACDPAGRLVALVRVEAGGAIRVVRGFSDGCEIGL
ncbi:MAG: tRNA pseudouridine(55) synthase TruB [Proteobacteria bacterium]|nr:tRNA pseudouridine(55) synthase TruB [Pseudomonadota bacterium]